MMQFKKSYISLLYLNRSIMSVINKFDFYINSNDCVLDLLTIDNAFNNKIIFVI